MPSRCHGATLGRSIRPTVEAHDTMPAAQHTAQQNSGGYVDANGVRTYYEVDGAGKPLVLLHGGLCAIETLVGLRNALAAHYRVYLPERRGHGRTPDVDGPYSYQLFADDTIAFIEALELGPAHVVGFSDGATIGLLTALRRPDLVCGLVHIGQQVNPSGLHAEFVDMFKLDAMPQGMLPPMLRELYDAVSPDGSDHWDEVSGKVWQMIRAEPNIDVGQLTELRAPTLVMLGEHDIVTEAHASTMVDAIPDARLLVIPDATHGLPMERPDLVGKHIVEFLAER